MQEGYLTVTELALMLNSILEEALPIVQFQGEIYQLTRAASGHLYFTVKDEDSQISAVMWRGTAASLKFKPAVGDAVLCHGQPSVYQRSGRLQIVVQRMLPAGEGDLRRRFLELKEKLEKEGLFAEERKRSLPLLPRAIGIVTSGSGAVIHDITVKLNERMPCVPKYLVDVRVQGLGAAEEIAAAIKQLGESGLVDVLIVGRGGGSLEDLWSFNEETVVRAIFASKVPVICGVGHEVDITLADLVADYRAPTPTAAAERAVPHSRDMLLRLGEYSRRLSDTDRWFEPKVQSVDELGLRLEQLTRMLVEQTRLRMGTAAARLEGIRPEKLLPALARHLDFYTQRLQQSARNTFHERQARIDGYMSRLEGLSHKRVLARGYSLVRKEGAIVTDASALKPEDVVELRFARSDALAEVRKVISKE